jgi:MoaA/NifB/PqqE/SkfB family radical SAM enzyme
METEFHFVPLAHNFGELQAIAKQARELGVKRVSVLRLVPQGRGAEGADMQLTNEQNLELRKIILHLRTDGHCIRLGSPYNFLMLRDEPKCCAGIDRLTIGPDLRVFPCDAFKHIPPESTWRQFGFLRSLPLYA